MAAKRLRIAPTWLVGVMSVSVVGLLYVAHPRGGIQARLAATDSPTALSIAYLEALLRSKPTDVDLLTFLGNQYYEVGRDNDARNIANRLATMPGDGVKRTAVLLKIAVDVRTANALKESDPGRAVKLNIVRQELADAARLNWSTPELQRLAATAASTNAQQVAKQLYARLENQDKANAQRWNAEVIRYAMFDGDYRTAADGWFRAQQRATDVNEQRRCFIAGIRVLQSGNMLDAALGAADRYGGAFMHDRQVLIVLLNLARAARATDRVDRYAKALAGYAQATPAPDAALLAAAPEIKDDGHGSRIIVMSGAWYDALGLARPSLHAAREGGYLDGTHPAGYRVRARSPAAPRTAMDEAEGAIVRVQFVVDPRDPNRIRAATNTSSDGPVKPQAASAVPGVPPANTGATKPTAASDAAQSGVGHEGDVPSLLYQSFLEASDLASAQRLANEQLAKHPDDPIWTRRLAQVAEWNRAPTVALQMWMAYAERTQDPEGWQNFLRLAPMLNDDHAYLAAVTRASNARPDDLKLLDAVTATYERLGRPDDGIAYLKARMKVRRGAALIAVESRMATLQTRAGHDDDAIATYQDLLRRDPANAEHALRMANLQYRHGDYATALQTLVSVRGNIAANDDNAALYWRAVAELARLQQKDEIANDAYRRLLATGKVVPDDLAAMTFFYDPFPIDAARTAEAQYRLDHSSQSLQAALHYYTDARALDAARDLLDGIAPDRLPPLESDPQFLRVRSDYYRAIGAPDKALADLDRAVKLPGATQDVQVSWLWSLVDYGTNDDIRRALATWPDGVQSAPPLWGPFAAAQLRLNRPDAALRYFRLQAASMSRDPLWLMAYAEALDQAGHDEQAWTLRRTVWRGMRDAMAKVGDGSGPLGVQRTATDAGGRPTSGRLAAEAEAREQIIGQQASLAAIFENADASRALLRDVLDSDAGRRDMTGQANAARASMIGDPPGLAPLRAALRGTGFAAADAATDVGAAGKDVAGDKLTSSVAKDVALAWALSHEGNGIARRWLARQYAGALMIPREQAMAIALADDDKPRIQQLLDQGKGNLSVTGAIDAAIALDRPAQAEQLAYRGLDGASASDVLHNRLLDTAMNWPQSLSAGVDSTTAHPLDTIEQRASGSVKIGEHYMVGVDNVQRFQRSADSTQLTNVPGLDTTTSVYVRRQTQSTAVQASAGVRHGASTVYPMSVSAEVNRGGVLSGQVSLGRDQAANESQILSVGGVKDNATVSARWNATNRIYASATFEAARYYSQARNNVGSGTNVSAELGYRVRTTYPDYTVRVIGVRGDYHASGSPDGLLGRLIPSDAGTPTSATVMPQSYTQYGAFIGFGTDARDTYSRAWRPYADIGIVHDSNQGWGPQASVGIGGSVFGGDRLVFYFSRQQVSGVGTAVTLMGVNYIYFY
ncbi:tetratricopeptide repeat protein [Robbsia andropogonis]|uniref:tetratricopeptide repeat protein n=1 Tax=Robbsia andropogonis TaxID=28092 RepID=UPI003D250B22